MIADLLTILTAIAVTATLIFWKRLATSRTWLATVTPLASIMGSGFLVSAPLLAATVGIYAAPAMAGLLLLAYVIGSAARFNIRYGEPLFGGADEDTKDPSEATDHRLFHGHGWKVDLVRKATGIGAIKKLESASQLVLVAAYIISVTYYLKLLAEFALQAVPSVSSSPALASGITTAVVSGIAFVGAVWGLKMLEKVERYAVGLNLGMVAALLVGLAYYNLEQVTGGTWALPQIDHETDPFTVARMLLGLLIVVQGFETSLFIGSEHPAEERIKTMRWAQWISAAVYLLFLSLATVLFGKLQEEGTGVTAIVALSGYAAAALPVMLTIAAVGSQFSAAVADDSGCGGLLTGLLDGKVSVRWIYLGIGTLAVFLTWFTDVKEIITVASRAFAVFYSIQCLIAALVAARAPDVSRRKSRMAFFIVLSIVCAAVALLGISAEG